MYDESSRLSQSLFDNSPSAIIIYQVDNEGAKGEDYTIVGANEACLATEGWDLSVIGRRLPDVRPGVDDFGIIPAFQQAFLTGETVLFPAKMYHHGDMEAWYENRIFRLPTGEVVSIYSDVTEAKLRELRIEYMSRHDMLTGLLNRAAFDEVISKMEQSRDRLFTLIVGDLDGLKQINDSLGYKAGDEVLKQAAEILKKYTQESDTICRWGGDEFIILLPNTEERVGVEVCQKIKESKGDKIHFTLGCAGRLLPGEPWRSTLKRAEDAMYKSKFLGVHSYRNVLLSSIRNTLLERNFETEEHGERMARYCRSVGKKLNMTANQLDELEVLGMLHDIGKIAIDDRILSKPGRLTPREYEKMKKHPEVGYRIACTIPELTGVAEYILSHHERWDGKGYPKGISGEAIPLSARIMSVADAYDAMTFDRPYRKAMSNQQARKELVVNAGSQFDPQIVEIFLACLDKDSGFGV